MQDIMNLDDQQSRLKLLIAKGKEQGYLTYAEVNDHLPEFLVNICLSKVVALYNWAYDSIQAYIENSF